MSDEFGLGAVVERKKLDAASAVSVYRPGISCEVHPRSFTAYVRPTGLLTLPDVSIVCPPFIKFSTHELALSGWVMGVKHRTVIHVPRTRPRVRFFSMKKPSLGLSIFLESMAILRTIEEVYEIIASASFDSDRAIARSNIGIHAKKTAEASQDRSEALRAALLEAVSCQREAEQLQNELKLRLEETNRSMTVDDAIAKILEAGDEALSELVAEFNSRRRDGLGDYLMTRNVSRPVFDDNVIDLLEEIAKRREPEPCNDFDIEEFLGMAA